MKESMLIKTINLLLFFASACLFHGLTLYVTDEHFQEVKGNKGKKTEVVLELPTKEKTERKQILPEVFTIKNHCDRVVITYQVTHYEYIGDYFITAYCPWECGYNGNNFPRGWTTSSGAICHYSESNSEPTTCAIDRNYFGFDETIAIDFGDDGMKTYVTEDTGAFRGMWIDCFVESMEEVRSWETGYYPVYSVSYETKSYSMKRTELFYERFTDYLLLRNGCDRIPYRNDCRIDD